MSRNATVLETCDGFVPSEMGLKAVNALTQPFENTYDVSGNVSSYGRFVDIVSNGGFASDPSALWTYESRWTWDDTNDEMDCAAATTAETPLQQTLLSLKEPVVDGVQYLLTFTIKNRSAGSITPYVGGAAGTARSANGTYSELITAGASGTGPAFDPELTFVGSVTDVSLSYLRSSSVEWPWPQIFRGRALTLIAGPDFIASVDEDTWYASEITLYDPLNKTQTVTLDNVGAGPWHFLDFGTTWALFNGNVTVYKYAGDTKTYVMQAPRVYTGCAFRGRAVIAGLPDGFPAVWRAIYDTLASNDTRLSSHALSLGKNFVLVSSPGGGGGNPGNVFAWADPSQNGSISGILGSITGAASVSSVEYLNNGDLATDPNVGTDWEGAGTDTPDPTSGWYWDSTNKWLARSIPTATLVSNRAPLWVSNPTNILTNGDFSDGDSGWTVGACWTVTGGEAIYSQIATEDEQLKHPDMSVDTEWYQSWNTYWTFNDPGFTYTDLGYQVGTNQFATAPSAWESRLQPSTVYQVIITMTATGSDVKTLWLYDTPTGLISSQAISNSGGTYYVTTPANLDSDSSGLLIDFFGHSFTCSITGFSVKVLVLGPGESTEEDRTISQDFTLTETGYLCPMTPGGFYNWDFGTATSASGLQIKDSLGVDLPTKYTTSVSGVVFGNSFQVTTLPIQPGTYTAYVTAPDGMVADTFTEAFVMASRTSTNFWEGEVTQPVANMDYPVIAGEIYELTYTVKFSRYELASAALLNSSADLQAMGANAGAFVPKLGGARGIPRTEDGTYTEMIMCGSNGAGLTFVAGPYVFISKLEDISLKGNTTTSGGVFTGIDPIVDDTVVPDGDGVITGDIDSAVGLQKYISLQRSLSRNDWMFMPMSFQGEVLRAEALGKSIMVFGEDGVCCMIPRTIEDVHTFQLLEFAPLRRIGLKGRGAVAVNAGDGTDESGELLFVDTQGWLWHVDTKLQPKKLGYKEFFSGMGTVVGSYHAYEDEFWFSDGTVTYVWNRSGLGQAPQDYISTVFADQTGTTYATIDPIETASTTYSLTTHPFNSGAPGMSSINEIAVLHTGLVDPEVALSYRYIDTATGTPVWGTTSYVRLNEQGFAHIKVTADEFKVHVRGTASTDCKVEGLIVEWELEDKRFIRSFMIQEQGMPGER
jgi:hypothetical protein